MTNQMQQVERAIRITPRRLRDRYAPEWRHDAQASESQSGVALELGMPRADVGRGALRLAWRLRAQWVTSALLLQEGWDSLKVWGVAVALLALAFVLPLFPVVLLVVLGSAALVLVGSGRPTRASIAVMVVSAIVGLCALIYAAWSIGASVDAADAFQPAPAAARYTGLALIVVLVSAAAFIGSGVFALRRPIAKI